MSAATSNMGPWNLEAKVNLLQEELEATNREVMLLTLELEQRVAERTAQLAQSNQKLLVEVAERIRAEAEIRKLNRELAKRATQLEAANEDLEAFSSSVSHDLRNPLARILGFAALLQEEVGVSTEKCRKYIRHISEAGRKMHVLIEDLLRLSHSSKMPRVWTEVDLNHSVTESIKEVRAEITEQEVEWVQDPLPTVRADASLLRQVFVNLLSNALKYSRRQQPARIEVREAQVSPEEWTIFVRDNGVGFDPGKKEKLFGAFQRLHAQQEFEGTGIGLVNVKRIILRHGGRVWAESRPGEGATFYVSLPKRPATEDQSVQQRGA